MSSDPRLLALELLAGHSRAEPIASLPSACDPGFGLAEAYAVEAELVRLRAAAGHRTVGRKVGYANRAKWRLFKLDTVLWAHMYDDTVHYAEPGAATLRVGGMYAPKIEPEIIFKLKHAPHGDSSDPAQVLEAVEWLALGFELVDCVFPDWKFQPADFVASFGLHAGLVVGAPLRVSEAMLAPLAEQLARATVRLLKDGALVAEGRGQNVLGNPALCLGELAAGLTRQPGADPLGAGELIASGALTDNQFIAAGEEWTAVLQGLELPSLTLRTAV